MPGAPNPRPLVQRAARKFSDALQTTQAKQCGKFSLV